jgi:hypothetical protein
MIYISDSLYISQFQSNPSLGFPLIGYQSILTISNVSADSSPDLTPVINLVNEQTNQFWKSDSLAEQNIYFNNSGSADIDYIGIAKHNFGSGGVEYKLQGTNEIDSDGMASWTDITDGYIPENNNAIMHHFTNTQFAIYRLNLIPDATLPHIAHIKLGKVLTVHRCIKSPHSPITLSRDTQKVNNTSEDGSYLGRIVKRRYLQTKYEFKNIRPLFYRQYVDPFSIHAETGCFFIAWKPMTYPTEVAYGWTNDNISFDADNDNGFGKFEFGMKAIA